MRALFAILLHFLPFLAGSLQDIVFAKRTGSIDIQPLVHTGTMKMVTTRKLPQLSSILISREADATFLQIIISNILVNAIILYLGNKLWPINSMINSNHDSMIASNHIIK